MTRRYRLIFMLLSFLVLLVVTACFVANLSSVVQQFWFAAGVLLLILLSLVDQPFFSKDANVFVNGVTGWVSLSVLAPAQRGLIWWAFFWVTAYLIISSYVLMWLRSKALAEEPKVVRLLSRVNRELGRPECIFSAFFLWGAALQFGVGSSEFNVLGAYWTIFTILNIPALAAALSDWAEKRLPTADMSRAPVMSIVEPGVVDVAVASGALPPLNGCRAVLHSEHGEVAVGTVVDDRSVAGRRIARIAITSTTDAWSRLAERNGFVPYVTFDHASERNVELIGFVDARSTIETLCIRVSPGCPLRQGSLLRVDGWAGGPDYYQIVDGEVATRDIGEGDSVYDVKVDAGQVGRWNDDNATFDTVSWVARPGTAVHRYASTGQQRSIPATSTRIGVVPDSDFPVHVETSDLVTHNGAILGITGSGKTHLAIHLIRSMLSRGIRVLVLDPSRQYFGLLTTEQPTAISNASQLDAWLQTTSLLGIHQFGGTAPPAQTTADFTRRAFDSVSQISLQPGVDEPARFCIVLEEAHALIPEWNQGAQSDQPFVNQTARIILQGRKYGLGFLVVTQRTANVTKTILNQCNTIFALRTFDQTGLDFLRNYMGDKFARALSVIPPFHAVVVGKSSSALRPVICCLDDFVQPASSPPTAPPQSAPEQV